MVNLQNPKGFKANSIQWNSWWVASKEPTGRNISLYDTTSLMNQTPHCWAVESVFFKFHSRILSGHSPEYSNAINNDGMVFEHPTISIVQRIRFEVMAKAQSKPEESGGAFKHKAMTWQLVVTCSPSFKHIANQRLAVSPDMNEQMHKGNTSNNWIQLIQIPEAQLVWPLVSKGASAHLKE